MKDHGGNLLSQRPARSRRFITGTFDEEERERDEEEKEEEEGGRRERARARKRERERERARQRAVELENQSTRVASRRARGLMTALDPRFQGVGEFIVLDSPRHWCCLPCFDRDPTEIYYVGAPKYPRRRWWRWVVGISRRALSTVEEAEPRHRRNEFSLLLYRQSRAPPPPLFLFTFSLHVITVSRRRDGPSSTHQTSELWRSWTITINERNCQENRYNIRY